jgi:urease accessory protein
MNALLLMLVDSRAPAGAHNHSGGMEAAVGVGLVAGLDDAERYCRARLRTSGRVAAAFAAAACVLQRGPAPGPAGMEVADAERSTAPSLAGIGVAGARLSTAPGPAGMALLDAELDARIPSAAARAASRQLGGGLRRLLRSMLPDADLVTPWAGCGRPAPHHALVLGGGVAMAGGSPELAARAAALAACTGPASAAVRLLGLDPFAVQAMLARLAPDIDECAERAAAAAANPPQSLPCEGAPALELLADFHLTAEVRLFAS